MFNFAGTEGDKMYISFALWGQRLNMGYLYHSYTSHTIPINNFNPQKSVKLNNAFKIREKGSTYFTYD